MRLARQVQEHVPRPWSERKIHAAAWAVILAFGCLQAWAHRFTMSLDGVSYLDIAENLSRGDWGHAVTGHWSPLFPGVIAIALLARPGPYGEFPLVHAVEFVLYIAALASFTFLMHELLRSRDRDSRKIEDRLLPRHLLLVFGYVFFLWTTLILITVYAVTPDLLVAAILYLASALVVRIRRGAATTPTWVILGIVLAVGYLAKTILLLLAPTILAAAFLVAPDRRAARWRLALAIGAWLAIATPWVGLLSAKKDRMTFGDAGRDTYAWEVSGVDPYRHWQGGPPGYGEPLHPTRLIYPDPPVYEFGEPIVGTYPVWYDPSYWYEGVRFHFSPKKQLLAIHGSLLTYLPIVKVFLLGWFILFAVGIRNRSDVTRAFTAYAYLLFPAVAGLIMYALVYVQARYVAGLWTLVALSLMLGLRLPESDLSPRVYRAGVLAIALALMADLCLMGVDDVRRVLDPPGNRPLSAASALRNAGVEPGERVAWIGGNFNPVWARLAQVQIVAEISIENSALFWSAGPAVREEILERLAATDATVVYASDVEPGAPTAGWTELGDAQFVRRLHR